MRATVALLTIVAGFVSACDSSSATAPLTAITAHGVTITVMEPGQCLVGGCDPPGAGLTHLGLITVTNTGTATAYLQACGDQPALTEQQLSGGSWHDVNGIVNCPDTPGPIALAPGDSIRANIFFATGRRRIVLGVATSASEADEVTAASAAFDVT